MLVGRRSVSALRRSSGASGELRRLHRCRHERCRSRHRPRVSAGWPGGFPSGRLAAARRAGRARARDGNEPRLRPLGVSSRDGARDRPVRSVGAWRRRFLGHGGHARAGAAGGAAARAGRRRRSAASFVASLVRGRADVRRRLPARRAGGRAPGGTSSIERAVVLHERLDLSDRARRRPPPRRREPVRP